MSKLNIFTGLTRLLDGIKKTKQIAELVHTSIDVLNYGVSQFQELAEKHKPKTSEVKTEVIENE